MLDVVGIRSIFEHLVALTGMANLIQNDSNLSDQRGCLTLAALRRINQNDGDTEWTGIAPDPYPSTICQSG